ncbi:MAG: isoprenylcysteine carboxylmethyltransferase family protein [Chloroflexi bacterium]|nr:MAG: isoprenylcysteine carboxylmethyltransferase family protein [Chloroflexota bacterium]
MKDNSISHHEMTPEVRQKINQWITQSAIGVVVFAFLLLLSAGRFDWFWGWVFIAVIALFMAAHPLILIPINPELLAEREKGLSDPEVKSWDRKLTLVGVGIFLIGSLFVAGLDERFDWTVSYSILLHIFGLVLTILGFGLFLWAMASNAFFAEGVRIQAERGHTVATGEPYQFVRHPGYAGAILGMLAIPFLLGSLWAVIPAAISACLYVLRTYLEDRTLLEELPGYQVYAQQTRYRLFPGVW